MGEMHIQLYIKLMFKTTVYRPANGSITHHNLWFCTLIFSVLLAIFALSLPFYYFTYVSSSSPHTS